MKLLLVSVTVRGNRYSSFIYTKDKFVTDEMLHKAFPFLQYLPRGTTLSFS